MELRGVKVLFLIHIFEPMSPERISYAVFCLKTKNAFFYIHLLDYNTTLHLIFLTMT